MARKVSRRVHRVGVATTDWSSSIYHPNGGFAMGGAGWIRFGQLASLSKHHMVIGKLVHSGDRLGIVGWDMQVYMDCDVLFVQRYMDDWVSDAVARAVRAGQVVVNDVDDWFWGLHAENAAAKMTDPVTNPKSNIVHYRSTLEASSLVTVSTPWLATALEQWDVKTRLIQNRVSTLDFLPRRHHPRAPVVGWTGSTAHRSGDLEVLAAVANRVPSLLWHHTGFHPTHPSFAAKIGVPEQAITTLPMLAPWEYPAGFVFDIGTVPLVDVPFNHAKSFIKGLEYAAAGIPFVASPLPEYIRLRDDYGIGRVANDVDEWVTHLQELTDQRVRIQEAVQQRKMVEESLDVSRQAKEVDDLIRELMA